VSHISQNFRGLKLQTFNKEILFNWNMHIQELFGNHVFAILKANPPSPFYAHVNERKLNGEFSTDQPPVIPRTKKILRCTAQCLYTQISY